VSQIQVSRNAKDRIRGGHLWVYRSDLLKADSAPGDVVDVVGPGDEHLGRAFYSDRSQIALRLLTTREENVDDDFWRLKLERALAFRRKAISTSNAYRWVHGESDGIGSLVVDRYGDYLVIQTLSQGTEKLKQTFVRLLTEIASPTAVLERNDPKVRALEGLEQVKGSLHGEIPRSVPVQEMGIQIQADLWEGQKTGLFLDQRENHEAATRYASGRALDVFAYHGGFSLHLARVCEEVSAVDISADALSRLRTNAELNNLTNIETIEANAFDLLRELASRRDTFDTIVLDPPAFAKNRTAVPQARRGYKEINLRALKLLRSGGHLITCTCSYHMKEHDFLNILTSAAIDARAQLLLREKRMQSRDHPVLMTMPETYYLKCLVLQKV
jgi:23S rRNA (cytosine1962-C5)-methyltransferase